MPGVGDSPVEVAVQRWRRRALLLALLLPLVGIVGLFGFMALQALSLHGGSTPEHTLIFLPILYLGCVLLDWPFFAFAFIAGRRLRRAGDRLAETEWAAAVSLAGLTTPYAFGQVVLAWDLASGEPDAGAGSGAYLAAAFIPAAGLALVGWVAGRLAAQATR
jgi:hypothetical protein